MTNTKKPEALRLADDLESIWCDEICALENNAANELRRLHEELDLQKALVAEAQAMTAKVCAENEALRADAERYRWLRSKSKETLLNPKGAASEFLPDMRTHWQMPVLICSGPIGGYLEFDAAIDAAMKGQP